jgi:hypothetical protein
VALDEAGRTTAGEGTDGVEADELAVMLPGGALIQVCGTEGPRDSGGGARAVWGRDQSLGAGPEQPGGGGQSLGAGPEQPGGGARGEAWRQP